MFVCLQKHFINVVAVAPFDLNLYMCEHMCRVIIRIAILCNACRSQLADYSQHCMCMLWAYSNISPPELTSLITLFQNEKSFFLPLFITASFRFILNLHAHIQMDSPSFPHESTFLCMSPGVNSLAVQPTSLACLPGCCCWRSCR